MFWCLNKRVHTARRHPWDAAFDVKISSYKTSSTSALYDGNTVYSAPKCGEQVDFEEGVTYVNKKNYTLSIKYGHECIFLGPTATKFKGGYNRHVDRPWQRLWRVQANIRAVAMTSCPRRSSWSTTTPKLSWLLKC